MLDRGFAPDVERILGRTTPRRARRRSSRRRVPDLGPQDCRTSTCTTRSTVSRHRAGATRRDRARRLRRRRTATSWRVLHDLLDQPRRRHGARLRPHQARRQEPGAAARRRRATPSPRCKATSARTRATASWPLPRRRGAGPAGDQRRRARTGRQPCRAGDQLRAAGIARAVDPPHRPHRPHGAAGTGDHPARAGGHGQVAPSGARIHPPYPARAVARRQGAASQWPCQRHRKGERPRRRCRHGHRASTATHRSAATRPATRSTERRANATTPPAARRSEREPAGRSTQPAPRDGAGAERPRAAAPLRPRSAPPCLGRRRARPRAGRGQHDPRRGGPAPRQRHQSVCAACGQTAETSFRPDPSRPVYCDGCYRERREQRRAAVAAS